MSDPDEPGRFIKASGLFDRSRVCLSVYGESLEPDEVSALLRCEPSEAWRPGDVIRGRARSRGAWLLEAEGREPIGPEELFERLLARLPEDPRAWTTLADRYETFWVVTGWLADISRGFMLSPDLQRRLAALGVPLGFDFYPPDDDDEE